MNEKERIKKLCDTLENQCKEVLEIRLNELNNTRETLIKIDDKNLERILDMAERRIINSKFQLAYDDIVGFAKLQDLFDAHIKYHPDNVVSL